MDFAEKFGWNLNSSPLDSITKEKATEPEEKKILTV